MKGLLSLVAAVAVVALLPGCAEPEGPHVVATTCSDSVKESSEPDGMPFGTFDHQLTNSLRQAARVTVEHRHASGCSLEVVTQILDRGETLELEYQDHLWGMSERIIQWNGETWRGPIDWACGWHYEITAGGLRDAAETHMCA